MNEEIKKLFLKNFGNRIKQCRKEKGISQEELANIVGYVSENARSSIQKIEAGKSDLPISKIKLFADALNTTPSYLMGWTEEHDQSISTFYSKSNEKELITIYSSLNKDGQEQLMNQAKILLKVEEYKKCFDSEQNIG